MSDTKPASPWYYAGPVGGITNTTPVSVSPSQAGSTVNGVTVGAQRQFMKAIQYFNTSATASEIVVTDGASTVIWRGYAPASMTVPFGIEFPIPLQSSPGNALEIAMLTTATATRVNAQGFTDV